MSRWPTTVEAIERVCEVQATRGSGPGGQHRNKVETGVRVSHPSGIVVVATRHRSRLQNLHDAYERISARLIADQHVAKPRHATKPTRGSQRRRLDGKSKDSDKKRARQRVDD